MMRRKYFLVVVSLLILYVLFDTFIQSSTNSILVKEKWIKKERKINEIELILNIQDIYRVDISCEFITKHLSSRISDKYKNTKKCS